MNIFSSLRSKMIVLLTGITLVTALILTINSVNTFKKDKIAYIFENNNLIISSASEKFRKEIELSSDIVKAHIASYSQKGTINIFPSPNLPDDYLVDGLEIFHFDNQVKKFTLVQGLKKKSVTERVIVNEGSRYSQFFNVEEKQKVLFVNGLMVIKESFGTNDNLFAVFYYFKPESLAKLFDEENPYYTFLVESSGSVVKSTDGLPLNFLETQFSFLKEKENLVRTLNSSTTKIESTAKEDWLLSSVSLGFSNLYLLAFVNEKKALSVLDGYYLRSILMFILMTSIVVILGIISATYLTGRISILSSATEKISDGDFSVQIDESGKDEIAALSSSFNKMAKQIVILMNDTAEKARMESELKTAQTVQSTLFPKSTTSYGNIRISGIYKSASECGGDWWHHSEVGEFIWIWIADATGHGVPAALLTSAAKSAVTLIESMKATPEEAIDYMNKSICSVSNGQMMMTCFLAQINKTTLEMKYINASHEAPIILRGDGDLKKKDLIFLTDSPGARLGQSTNSQYMVSTVQLEKSDRLLLYSDGIPDIRTPQNESLGERGFIRTLLNSQNKHLDFFDFANDFHNQLEVFRQKSELIDDVTYCFVELQSEF
jgi:phosphoserine phosphatase RsbU/P